MIKYTRMEPTKLPTKLPRQKPKKADLNTRIGKYYINKTKGMTKMNAALAAGYPDGNHTTQIERSDTYQAIEDKYKDVLLKHISMDVVALAHADNITQDKDRGARNKAIEMFKDAVEPDNVTPKDDSDRIMVILR